VSCVGQAIAAVVAGDLPDWYMSTCRHLTLSGHRVLALAIRVLGPEVTRDVVSGWSREQAETEMTFVGFLVLSTPLKVDSVTVIKVHLCV
jgi:cation-transporting ATPase 13A1